MINRRTFLAAAVSAAVLTGCAVGPDYDRPYVPVRRITVTSRARKRISAS